MAFNVPPTFALITQPIGIQGIQIWSYQTDDPISEIVVAGYFTDVGRYGAHPGDMILCVASDGSNSFAVSLTSIDVAGDGTALHIEDFPLATQEEAEEGTGNASLMTPLRTAQAIDASTFAMASGPAAFVDTGHPERLHVNILRDVISIKSIGNCGGLSSSTATWEKAWNEAINENFVIHLPADTYYVEQVPTISVPSASDRSSPRGFGLRGDSARGSRIVIPASADTGILDLNFTGTNTFYHMEMTDWGILVEGTKTKDLLRLTSTNVGAPQHRQLVMNNFRIDGTVINIPVTSARMMVLDGLIRPFLRDLYLVSASVTGWDDDSAEFVCQHGISFNDCYGPELESFLILGASTCINNGGDAEGLRITNFVLTGAKTGVRYIRGAGSSRTITGVTKANPGVVSYTGTAVVNGDMIFIPYTGPTGGMVGMNQLLDRRFTVAGVSGSTFQLTSPIDGTNIDTSAYTAWVSGGTFVDLPATGAEPGPALGRGHTHTRECGVELHGTNEATIFDLSHYTGEPSTGLPTNGYGFGIWATNYNRPMITNCTFTVGETINRVGIFLDARQQGQRALIAGNQFGGSPTLKNAIWIKGNDVGSQILDAQLEDVFAVPILDESATASQGVLKRYIPAGDRLRQTIAHPLTSAARAPIQDYYRESPSPANNDLLGAIEFSGNNNAAAKKVFASIEGRLDDVTAASEDGGLNFYARKAGTETIVQQQGTALGTYIKEGLVLIPPASATPANNGDMTFQLTSNTSLVIKVKGSDGTVRSGTVTLS